MTVTPPVSDPGLIVFDDTTLEVKLYGVDVFYGGDHTTGTYTPGTYSVEIKSQADNPLVDTGAAHVLTLSVTIVDPCDSPTGITVLPAIFTEFTYFISDPTNTQTLTSTDTVTTTEAETTIVCPSIFFEVTDGADSSLLDSIFSWDSAA